MVRFAPVADVPADAVLSFYASASTSMVELWLHPPAFTTAVAEKPVASPLARRLVAQGNRVTNLRQEALYVNEPGRQVVRRLDGSHDRWALLDELM